MKKEKRIADNYNKSLLNNIQNINENGGGKMVQKLLQHREKEN